MNLLTHQTETIKALVEIEGGRWLQRQRDGQFKGYSVFDSIEELKRGVGSIIYGNDGWNRYVVCADGEVEFIELQAGRKSDIGKAEKLGFKLL